jgi:hypothetical protein
MAFVYNRSRDRGKDNRKFAILRMYGLLILVEMYAPIQHAVAFIPRPAATNDLF